MNSCIVHRAAWRFLMPPTLKEGQLMKRRPGKCIIRGRAFAFYIAQDFKRVVPDAI